MAEMINLTPSQQCVVDCDDRYCLVTASAGSGKTLVLCRRIERLLRSLKRGEKVLALTFTNKAARELRERLLQSFSEEELAARTFVGTIHSFSAEFVARRGSTIGLPSNLHIFESTEDRLAVFAEAVAAVPQVLARLDGEQGLRKLFENLGRARRSEAFAKVFFSVPENTMVFDEYQSRMILQHAVDFDDVLAYTAQILSEQPTLAKMYQMVYRHICIDEAQDLNDSQYSVVQALAGSSCGITMVGDTKQAIYGFNGSSSDIMARRFPSDYHPVAQFVLEENFRSSKAVMRYARVIEPTSEMIPTLAIEGEVACLELANEEEEACWIASRIHDLITGSYEIPGLGDIAPENCAVLARNRYVFSSLRGTLEKAGIPYFERVATGSAASSESDLFKYFHTGLRLMVNPNDRVHLDRLNDEFRPEGPFGSFEEILHVTGTYDGLTPKASDALRLAWELVERDGDPRLGRALDVLEEVCENGESLICEEDRLLAASDCAQWRQWWERYRRSTGPSSRSLSGLLRAISLGEVSGDQAEEGVRLSSIHLSKGLEFDVVFVIGLNDGTFPDYRAHSKAQLDEERHSMFVAITRSKRVCYVTRPKVRRMPWGDLRMQAASPFFQELLLSDS